MVARLSGACHGRLLIFAKVVACPVIILARSGCSFILHCFAWFLLKSFRSILTQF